LGKPRSVGSWMAAFVYWSAAFLLAAFFAFFFTACAGGVGRRQFVGAGRGLIEVRVTSASTCVRPHAMPPKRIMPKGRIE